MIRTFFALFSLSAMLLCGALAGCDETDAAAPTTAPASPAQQQRADDGMVALPGGTFVMGTNDGFPHEGPAHEVTVRPFKIDKHEVTVAQFAKFVAATGYKTEAEAWGWSGVFDPAKREWAKSDGATWREPDGPGSRPRDDEPVCQVSYNDALAYAKWAGKRLPTEAEWEFAARGGLKQNTYAWGNELRPGGEPVANWWQGVFPQKDTAEDGFRGRAPVGKFAPNGYGLYDMSGNVWEWCSDWYADDYYLKSPTDNPTGPPAGENRVIRGGSWMCSENYCNNYRVAGRSKTTPDTALNNLGFRCAKD
ncbi:MAG TPA: formylglycine-generating enzyme family protein [Tepidisphaeraceae bacterium]|nr:formylglycine-generating enzyme family protein [Tepidisphaeraceae bacterium]